MSGKEIKSPHYAEAVVMFAVAQRTLGRRWKDIAREITEIHGIRAPTPRQMRQWFYQWGPKSAPAAASPYPGLRERLLRLQNTYRYLSSDSAYNREMATAGLLLHHIDTIASHSAVDREHQLESIVAILTLIERWAGAHDLDLALREFQLARRLAIDDTSVRTEKAELTSEKPGTHVEELAEKRLAGEGEE
jgi:hypothetical protein